jgi:PAS domain S-box-containing protein
MTPINFSSSDLSNLGFAVWSWDIPANKLEWSPEMFRLFGVREADFIGAYDAWEQTLHPEDKERAVAKLQSSIKDKTLFDSTFRILSPSLGLRYIAAKGIVEYSKDGLPLVMRGVNWDISEHVILKEKISDMNLSLESVFNSLEEGLVVHNPKCEIIKSNKAAERILDLTEDELHGRTSLDPKWTCIKFDGSPFEGKDHPVPLAIQTGELQKDVLMGVNRKDGTVSWISITAIPRFDHDHSLKDVICTFVDVTKMINMQKDLEKKTKVLNYNAKLASLGEMAAGVAHEINNPLTIIFGKLEQIKYMIKDGDPIDKVDAELTKIQSSSDRIARIIKGLRYFSKTSEDPLTEHFNLNEVLMDASGLIKGRLNKVGIELTISPFDYVFVEGKKNLIVQTILNVLTNSIEAIENLVKKWIVVDLELTLNRVKILISDSGTGIDEKISQKMMEPFFSTKDVGQGTGLGLSISLGNIQACGGELYYTLRNGHTCFVIELLLATKK